MLFGRSDACNRIDAVLSAFRGGTGGALVLTGPPGIGKTALLDYAANGAKDLTDPPRQGHTDLKLPSPTQVCPRCSLPCSVSCRHWPLHKRMHSARHWRLAPPPGVMLFPVYAGTVSLLAAASRQVPSVVLIDDAQWMDEASMVALRFAQRRLVHDPILFILTSRSEPENQTTWAELPGLQLDGLDDSSAAALLRDHGFRMSDDVLRWLIQATNGNPLASAGPANVCAAR